MWHKKSGKMEKFHGDHHCKWQFMVPNTNEKQSWTVPPAAAPKPVGQPRGWDTWVNDVSMMTPMMTWVNNVSLMHVSE